MVNLTQVRDGQVKAMGGEKSEQGIVVNKLTRNVAKVSDLIRVIKKSLNPKGRDSMRSPSVHGRKKLSYLTIRHVHTETDRTNPKNRGRTEG